MIYDQLFDLLVSKPQVASAVAAIGSVAVAIIALIFSIGSSAAQRKHNRLSVRPLASVLLGDYEKQVYVKLTNNGTGPMIIKSIRIINAPDPSRPLIDAMPKLQPGVDWAMFLPRAVVNRSIRPGGVIVLLLLASKCSDSKFILSRDQVRQALGRLEVHVEYTDIYGSTLPIYTRNLDLFHRAKEDDLS